MKNPSGVLETVLGDGVMGGCFRELCAYQSQYRDETGEPLPDYMRHKFVETYFEEHDKSDCNTNVPNYEPSFADFNNEEAF